MHSERACFSLHHSVAIPIMTFSVPVQAFLESKSWLGKGMIYLARNSCSFTIMLFYRILPDKQVGFPFLQDIVSRKIADIL